MKKLFGLIKKLDDNLLRILLSFFIFFVPLWPKIPLKMINYTYISIRVEDIYMVLMSLVFLIQLLRGKVRLNKDYLYIFSAFWGAVLLSTVWGIFVSKTILYAHLGFLHFLRRVEYMLGLLYFFFAF
ncbi:hypothetical protein B6D29_02645 [Microgenomates bacterium UTCPR1]|nr:MAG: hypothetical protein B6D29_02645 [Microgenomates bacterium UTCPR1]